MSAKSVAVIGLGKISFDYGKPEQAAPYCHVGGIAQTGKVDLKAVCDLDAARHEAFTEKWGGTFPDVAHFSDIDAMFKAGPIDIVAVCTRGPSHAAVLEQVIAWKPRAIFLEKPPTCSLDEMDHVRELASEHGIPITVSYSRHWHPATLRMAELIGDGLIGEVKHVVGYSRGTFLSFASHTTDLICQFAGYDAEKVFAHGTPPAEGDVPEGYQPEPVVGAVSIAFSSGRTGVLIGENTEHGGMYCDVYGDAGRARVGMYVAPLAWDADGNMINLEERGMPDNASVFKAAYEQIADHLDGGPLPDCTDDNFAMVHEISFAAIESLSTGNAICVPNAYRSARIFANG